MFFLLFLVLGAIVTFVTTRNIVVAVVSGIVIGALAWVEMPVLTWGFTGVFLYLLLIPAIVGGVMYTLRHDNGDNQPPFAVISISTVSVIWVVLSVIIPFVSSSEMMNAAKTSSR